MNESYIAILQYLKEYGGEKYKALDKCNSTDEKKYMAVGSENGKTARELFSEIVGQIRDSFSLIPGKITQWQNSGNFVKYFWCQLKKEEYIDDNISISLFAEKTTECVRFRVSVELAMDKSSYEEIQKYKRILDLPLAKDLSYISGGNNDSVFETLEIKDNNKVKALNLKKVQVSYVLSEDMCKTNESVSESIINGVRLLMGYYDFAMSKNTTKPSKGEKDISMTYNIKDSVDKIKEYIKGSGFSYENGLIENFYLSLKSKPFVILAGTSGTGKTRLVRLFAEAISAEYQLVAVRPDWSDSSDLFGHVDLNGNFIPGAVLDFMNRAKANPERPYILCLDEMNLARVEYYLSDILSIMETREVKDGFITSDPVLNESYYGKKDIAAREKYGVQRMPENFYIVGTVNMDETTFPFSRKVLDRANTIEFSYVDLDNPEFGDLAKPDPEKLSNSFLKTEYLFLKQCVAEEEYVKAVCADLQRINGILQKAEAHVGYRVRDEIVFYMLNNKKAGLLSEKEAFDNEIMQKILPRIQGSSASVKKLLCSLFVECAGSYSDSNDSDSKNMEKYLEEKRGTLPYPKSAEKIMFMTRRFEEDGFTSYWL